MNAALPLPFHTSGGTMDIVERARTLFAELESLAESDRIEAIDAIRLELHRHSPFADEPVDCVQWVPAELVTANDYNPNSVAPPEMDLLRLSIAADGYTQPIVSWSRDGLFEVVDGFHRHRVGKECDDVRQRVRGYLPLVVIKAERQDKGDRMAATIRHNRARGKHRVDAMSEIVMDLKRRRWSNEKIGRELGMDPDEVLRLCQVTGLAELFADREFSQAWEADLSDPAEVASVPEVGGLESGDVAEGLEGGGSPTIPDGD
jgi:ParB-like chromosome segregation protein Spo0J